MRRNLRKHWLKLALFGGITTALVICCTPDVTWACLDYDLFDFMYSATYLGVGHAAGFPLYTLLGWLVTRLPGNDAWNLAFFLSVIPTLITCGLIFYIVNRRARGIAPYVATAAFAGSMVVFSQAIIPEIYALTTMLMVLAYVLCERGNFKLGMLAIGFGMAVHYLAFLALPILIWKYLKPYRKNILTAAWFIPPLLLYLYLPLANRPPYMSLGPTSLDTLQQYLFQHGDMVFNLPIWELPQRIGEGVVVAVASLGIALVLVLVGIFKRENRTLLYLAIPGLAHYFSTLGTLGYVHTIPAFAFTTIAAGYVLSQSHRPTVAAAVKRLAPAALVCSLLLLAMNTYNYDIGRTLDPEPTGARQFLTSLDEIDEGGHYANSTQPGAPRVCEPSWAYPPALWVKPAVIVCWDAVTYAGVHYYNEQNGRNLAAIHPVFINTEDANWWELERYPELKLNYGNSSRIDVPPPSGDWLADYCAWALVHTEHFAELNPHVTVYATLSNLDDRTRRGIWLVEVSGN